MLYLIKSENYLKIGYTDNLARRVCQYKTHNPNFQVEDSMEGTKDTEKQIHKLIKEYQYQGEWFKDCTQVRNIWNDFKRYGIGICMQSIANLQQQIHNLREELVSDKIKYTQKIQENQDNCKEIRELVTDQLDLTKLLVKYLAKEKNISVE